MVDILERDLIRGRARWMADLSEFFRDYRVMDTTFDLFARGRTRNRGLFLSKFFAVTALPDYPVSLFCVDESGKGAISVEKIRRRLETVRRVVEEKSLKWAWLLVFVDGKLSPSVVAFTERYERTEIGVAIGSLTTRQSVFSNNQIGLSIRKRLGLERFLRRLKNGKTD